MKKIAKRVIAMVACLALLVSFFQTAAFVMADDVTIKDFVKTATWTDDAKTKAHIDLTSTFDKKITNGKILFLGGLCNAHSLNGTTVIESLETCAKYGTIDYFLYSVNESQQETSGTPITGSLAKGGKLSDTVKNNIKNKLASQRHVIQYKIADKINSTDLSKYDAVVLECDAFKMGRQSSAPTTTQRNNLAAAGKKLLPLYEAGKIYWIIPPKTEHGSYDGTSTYLFGDYYISGKDISGSSKITDNMRKAAFDCLALLAPEDYLTSDGKPKSYPASWNTTTLSSFTHLIARANATGNKKIYVTYDNADDVATFLGRRFSYHGYETAKITDEVNAGFKIESVEGQYYDATQKKYVTMPKTAFSYEIDATNKQKVTAIFDVTNLVDANIRLTISVSVLEGENDPFQKKETVETNKGKATIEYFEDETPVKKEEAESPTLTKLKYLVDTTVVNGTITPDTYVYEGYDLTVNYANNEYYKLDKITVDGTELTAQQMAAHPTSYKFEDVGKAHSIKVEYKIVQHTATFDSNGGSNVSSQTKDHGAKLEKPTDPTKTGYTFDKWYKDNLFQNAWDFANDTLLKDETLYGKWTEDTHTLSYDANGGTNAPSNQTMKISQAAYVSGSEPTLDGHTFQGWATTKAKADAGTVEYDPGDLYLAANVEKADATLYAVWNENNVTVNYNATTGGTVNNSSDVVKVFNGDPAGSTASNNTGYHFVKWQNSQGTKVSENLYFKPSKNPSTGKYDAETYTAVFAINSYDVTFDMKGHSTQVPGQTVNHGGKPTKPANPSETGYTFGGWYHDSTCQVPWNFATDTITQDTTLYALWTENEVTINYNATTGGTVNKASETVKVFTGDPAGSTASNTTGYHFVKWQDSQGAQVSTNPYFKPSKNASTGMYEAETYTAVFAINPYDVTFDMKGHGTQVPAQVVNHGGKATKPADPAAEGYNFGGWFRDTTCQIPWNFGTDTITQDTTIYAMWVKQIAEPEDPAKPAKGITVTNPADRVYTGEEFKPEDYTIKFNGKKLVPGKDFEVIGYETNVEVGTAYVVVKGKLPNFAETLKIPFNILPPPPKTGDEQSLPMWAVLALLSCAGFVFFGYKAKKLSAERN